ncbi:MAG: type III toxin-antitoxin system ToxN/AbiQ family toxin [Clostridia bacterium]|nr:type III toxin-antitoxin system ToxN/AbiQ family toxin [Clostridia bacterium]
MNKLNFYKINEKYVKYMSKFDNRISKSYDEKRRRPFIGIVLNVEGILYFAPFTSPKRKHVTMKNTIDFLKIDDGRLGAINFNNMIPIPIEECIKIDIENEQDKNYKALLHKQINWCNKRENVDIILNRAKKIYEKVLNKKLPEQVINRCCDFNMLEGKLREYIQNK